MENLTRRFPVFALLATTCLVLTFFLGSSGPGLGSAEGRKAIVVELAGLPPTVAAADQARRQGLAFDAAAHDRAILGSQHAFLAQLHRRGIDYRVTESSFTVAGVSRSQPNRFTHLINAIGLDVPAAAVGAIQSMPGVRHITPDEPMRPHLADSVRYIRANDGPGDKTIFSQAGGPLTRFDGSGQVIAAFDSGIDSTHPMFDTRFSDADFLMRTGDLRPVRLAGEPYSEGVHHPKVVYFITFTATGNQDDGGHGSAAASHAAGVKVKGPGLDRIPGTADDVVVEGVAPAALLMNYKVCEGILTCVGTATLVTALTDALSAQDPLGFAKPIANVINMSFGNTTGNPNDATAVAANNAALVGALMVASAGNSGPNENTHGTPAAGRRVIGVAATIDPGEASNELDVLAPDPLRYTVGGMSTGAQNDSGRTAASQDRAIKAILMGGAPDVTFPLGQHYVYAGLADTPDQVPLEVFGRIALASRGSSASPGGQGIGLFANKAAEAAAKGAVALLVFNNVDGELEAATTTAAAIPVHGVSQANGEYLRDALGFQSPAFDKTNPATWGTISKFPLRINLPNPANFSPSTTGFSSRGPIDNFQYVKPDVTAPGQNIYGATVAVGGVRPTDQASMFDPSRYINASGTSFSAPHVSGAGALVRQALLDARGQSPLDSMALRSGAAATSQQAQNEVVPMSLVRAALTNTATNLREADGETPVLSPDSRNLIHQTGSGLIHVRRAADARAAMGTNDANGPGGPDDARSADFLPTHSFGENAVIGTGNQAQTTSITVTVQNTTGAAAAGTYTLSLADGGALRGDVTRPIVGTTGFQLSLSTPSVSLGGSVGDAAPFDVSVTVDGRPAPTGLALAGIDVTGREATEFLWWVVANGSNGQTLRMPFFYRAATSANLFRDPPFQDAIQDDATPDQEGGVDRDGNYRLSWTFPGPPSEQPCGFQVEEARILTPVFSDDGSEPLLAGANSIWTGAVEWISSVHPTTGSLAYAVVYHDLLSASLTMVNAVSIPAGTKAQLVFDSFESIEDDFDFGFVEASVNGSGFLTLAQYTGSFSGQRVLDLSRFEGKSVRIRFRFTSDLLVSAPLFLGWFIDNIQIQTADWNTIGTVGSSAPNFDVTGRASGAHFYRIAGLFGDGCAAVGPYSNLREITVDRGGAEPVAPTADFTADPNLAEVGQSVTFDASASHDNDDVGCDPSADTRRCIVGYFWSFGDGGTQTTSSPTTTHAYAAPGTYRVSLTVTDDDAQTDFAELFEEVTEAPKPTEQKVTGAGWIPAGGGKADFGFNAQRNEVPGASPTGNLHYDDKNGRVKVLSESITSLTITGNSAEITGTCSVNKVSGFTFTLEVTNNDGPGNNDFLRIRLDNGYDASGTLGGGSIQIHD